ncbi:MAG: Gfo/Idh/MocA family oxidoreductase [Thermomicrobiales bacterium]
MDWRELIGRPDVDAVIMATPQQVRPDIAVAAAAAGKHLLCEKTLAAVPADAHRMVELSTFRSSWGRSATESGSGVCLGSRVREYSAGP